MANSGTSFQQYPKQVVTPICRSKIPHLRLMLRFCIIMFFFFLLRIFLSIGLLSHIAYMIAFIFKGNKMLIDLICI